LGLGCATKIALVGENRRLYELCREILAEQRPGSGGHLIAAEPRLPLPEADLYIWDYNPGLEIAWESAAQNPRAHLVVVDRAGLSKSRQSTAAGAIVLLKPVTKAALSAWLEQALEGGPEGRLRRERDEMLQALIETNLRLQEYDQDRTTFLATAIHDFRAPLTATSGYCGLLLDGQLGLLTEPQKEVLRRIQTSVRRLSRMTAAMFQLSVGPRIQRAPNLEQADIRETVGQALHEIGPRACERRIQVISALAPPAQTMYFEREQLEQVVLNLLDNACKFTPKNGRIEITGYPWPWERRLGTVQRRVESERRVRESGEPNAYRIDVWNSGPGIEPERLERIFEEYATYGGPSSFGSGLGLAICKVIVQQHRGRIWAENRDGGPMLSFVIPFKPDVGAAGGEAVEAGAHQVKGTNAA
jgi:signal transduction histidine kinase